ncbi:MAG: PaaI family thioesterase [Bacteroidota bacterium]
MTEEHFRKLERMYLSANYNQHIYRESSISITAQRTEISLIIQAKYFHALSAIHGSVYFKMLDDAAYFATSIMFTDYFILTTHFDLDLLRAVKSGIIRAIGKVVSINESPFTAEAFIVNEAGKKVASGRGKFVKSKISLSSAAGYQ